MAYERMIYRCGILAERLRSLGQSVALEAANRESRPFAIVADETLKLGLEVEAAVEAARFPGPGPAETRAFARAIADPARSLSLLAINSAIESLNSKGGAAVAICVDGIREAALELESLCAGEAYRREGPDLPNVASPSLASTARDYLLAFSAGGRRFLENFGYLREVMRYSYALPLLEGATLRLRDHAWPFVDLAVALGQAAAPGVDRDVIVVRARWEGGDGREYAVAVDRLGAKAILRPRVGRPVEARVEAPLAGLVRECWDASDGSQFLFLDWPRLLA
jgi:chemotaxis signal transduction protein